jgi:chromosome segregation ATPase
VSEREALQGQVDGARGELQTAKDALAQVQKEAEGKRQEIVRTQDVLKANAEELKKLLEEYAQRTDQENNTLKCLTLQIINLDMRLREMRRDFKDQRYEEIKARIEALNREVGECNKVMDDYKDIFYERYKHNAKQISDGRPS